MKLEEIDLDPKKLEGLVIDRIVDMVITKMQYSDEDGNFSTSSPFITTLNDKVKTVIDKAVQSLCDKHILPMVSSRMEGILLQETSKWGEKKGEPLSFVEYMLKRAEAYLVEKVDSQGKNKEESGGYSWSGAQNRLTYMVHQHLHHNIEEAMKKAVAEANNKITSGILETTKIKLEEISKSLKISVGTGR